MEFYFEKAFNLAKLEVFKLYGLQETDKNKLIVYDVVNFEIGWIFHFENYYLMEMSADDDPEKYKYFNVYPVFVDRNDGEVLHLFLREDESTGIWMLQDKVIIQFIDKKYPDYWKNKELKLEAQRKEDEEFDEWIKTVEAKDKEAQQKYLDDQNRSEG